MQDVPYKGNPIELQFVPQNIVQFKAFGSNTILLQENGKVHVAGRNYDGELGVNHRMPVKDWTPLSFARKVARVHGSPSNSYLLISEQTFFANINTSAINFRHLLFQDVQFFCK